MLIKEKPNQPIAPANLSQHFQYVPFDPDKDDMPTEAMEMIVDYDPEKEVILMIADAKGQTVCLQMTAEKLGVTPLEAYKEQHGRLVPGHVYRLAQPIDAVPSGYYIYEREEKALLVFCRAGMDDDEGDLCRTDEVIKIHCDFRECFEGTEMRVEVE